MAENLKTTRYMNGDEITFIDDPNNCDNNYMGHYAAYNNDLTNINTYGYLYNWSAANDIRGICPDGFHLPSDEEWSELILHLDPSANPYAENHDDIKVDNSSFFKAIWTILLADFTMSLDNVLGVAGAAGDHYGLLVFGLVLSIALMAFAATLISSWIKKYKWIAWAGLIAILIVAIELIYTDIKILFL